MNFLCDGNEAIYWERFCNLGGHVWENTDEAGDIEPLRSEKSSLPGEEVSPSPM